MGRLQSEADLADAGMTGDGSADKTFGLQERREQGSREMEVERWQKA